MIRHAARLMRYAGTFEQIEKQTLKLLGIVAGLSKVPSSDVRKISATKPGPRADIVYLWVDSSDPKWIARFNISSSESARFRNFGELLVSLQRIEHSAPWANNIFIVTDGQVPEGLERLSDWIQARLKIVDHTEIIPSSYLPIANSHSLTSFVYRIPDLSEHFVLMNDDVFFGRPTIFEDWFPDSKPSYQLSSASVDATVDLNLRSARQNTLKALIEKSITPSQQVLQHGPMPMLRSEWEKIETEFAPELERTRKSRYRSGNDIVPELLYYLYLQSRGVAQRVFSRDYVYVGMANRSIFPEICWILLRHRNLQCFCLNDASHGRSVPLARLRDRYNLVLGILERASE